LVRILRSARDTPEWDELAIGRFVPAHYGRRSQAAVLSVLSDPSLPSNVDLQLGGLIIAAAAPGLDVPTSLLMSFATGLRLTNVGGTERSSLMMHALLALAARPDRDLATFWVTRLRTEADDVLRQAAIVGLACALGNDAEPYLREATGLRPELARLAQQQLEELATFGASARVCGGGTVSQDGAREYFPALQQREAETAARFLGRVP
jgi:hypothetical protein